MIKSVVEKVKAKIELLHHCHPGTPEIGFENVDEDDSEGYLDVNYQEHNLCKQLIVGEHDGVQQNVLYVDAVRKFFEG